MTKVWQVLVGIKYLCDRGKALAALTAESILLTPSGQVKIGKCRWGNSAASWKNVALTRARQQIWNTAVRSQLQKWTQRASSFFR